MLALNPFMKTTELAESANIGAVSIEQERAIAEAQGQLIIAKRFPRDEFAAHEKLMRSCGLHSLASVAFYNVPRAGGSVSGPSIRLAEEIARVYGNFEYGHKELSRSEGKSEVVVYAWDKENNNFSTRQITVMHVLDYNDKKTGQKMSRPLHDQKDIDDKIANIAAKQMRGRILALLPKWMVEEAVQKCRQTLAGNSIEPLDNQIRRLMQAFATHGVTTAHVKEFIGCEVSEITSDQLVDLIGVYNSINDGGMKASEFFGAKQEDEPKKTTSVSAMTQTKADPATKKADKPKATNTTTAPADDAPEFEAHVLSPEAQKQADRLVDCQTLADMDEWAADAGAKFPAGHADYDRLLTLYNQRYAQIPA